MAAKQALNSTNFIWKCKGFFNFDSNFFEIQQFYPLGRSIEILKLPMDTDVSSSSESVS